MTRLAPTKAAPSEQKTLFMSATEVLSQRAKLNPLIGKLIERNGNGVLFGQSGSGKTFVALDMACSVACGGMWNGHQCEKGMVLYFVGEGYHGLVRRLHAWHKHNGCPDLSNLHLSRSVISLGTAGISQVVKEIRAIEGHTGQRVAFIVIDTLARHIEGDENTAKDMGIFVKSVDALRSEFPGSTTMSVHHSGKNVEKANDPRGSTALKGACEFMIQCDNGLLTYGKEKDGPLPEPEKFKLVQVEVGTDDDGEPITSCVVEYGVQSDQHKAATSTKQYTASERMAIKALTAVSSGPLKDEQDGEYGGRVGDWRQKFYELQQAQDPDRTIAAMKKAFDRAGKTLIDKGSVVELGPTRFLVSAEHQAEIRAAVMAARLQEKGQGT